MLKKTSHQHLSPLCGSLSTLWDLYPGGGVGRFHHQLRVSTQLRLRVRVRGPAGRKTNLKPIKPIDPHSSPHHLHCLSRGADKWLEGDKLLLQNYLQNLPFSLQIVFHFVLVVATESFPNCNQSIWRKEVPMFRSPSFQETPIDLNPCKDS